MDTETRSHAKPGTSTSERATMLERARASGLLREAQVSDVVPLTEKFRLIKFNGDALRNADWLPGDKVQIKIAPHAPPRAYTPIYWDGLAGTTGILAYSHGSGLGSQWARSAGVGDPHYLFGPRRSIDSRLLSDDLVVFGDETSMGLAAALHYDRQSDGRTTKYLFEVTDEAESASVISALKIQNAMVVQRQHGDAHLYDLFEVLKQSMRPSTMFIMTGKAPSIARLHHALKERGVDSQRFRTKAYWAPGKSGLD